MSHSIPGCDAKESLREGNMRMGFQTQLILRQLFSLISDGFKSWTNSKFAAYLYAFLRIKKCSDWSLEVKLPSLLGNYDQRTDLVIGKFHFQQCMYLHIYDCSLLSRE